MLGCATIYDFLLDGFSIYWPVQMLNNCRLRYIHYCMKEIRVRVNTIRIESYESF